MISEIYNQDCIEAMKLMKDKQFDLAIVDPPYRTDNSPTKSMRKLGGKMNDFGQKPDINYFNELRRVSKNQIIWGAQYFIPFLPETNCMIFWYKHNPMNNYSDGEFEWTSFGSVSKCFDYPYHGNHEGNTIIKDKIHPTQKPIKLYRWLLKNYATHGQTILDTHLGSGSSRIAAYDLGFDFTGYEIDKDYFDDSDKRFKQFISQQKLF